jgi:DNA repair protein RadC
MCPALAPNTPVFASTGPAGHRGRMRERILAHGGDALADYEIIEMLLFLGIPRGDTKPLAKGLINRFGSLGAVLAAPAETLANEGGLDAQAVLPFRLVAIAAERLSRREIQDRPLLNSLDTLERYLRDKAHQTTRILFLDNRNRLLGDEEAILDDAQGHVSARAILRRALALHATALLVADNAAAPERAAARAAKRLREAASLLSIVLHDRVALGPEGLMSYRRAGLLSP